MPRKQSINGEREITLSFLRGDINDKFIADIETGWTANFKGDKYHLFNEREDQHGNKEFDAVLDFFHHFNGRWHVDDVDDKSMTIDDSIRPLFDDSPYVLSIIDNFYANTMNYSKQQNSTERFLYFIGRHNAEFNIPIGTQTVQVRNKIGVQRNDVFIHEDDNLVDFNITTDTGSFCTAIKGYYRFRVPAGSGDSTEKEPTRTYDYISPMASKYGVIWGEPIHDERFDTLECIQAATKQKQEATWKSSFEIAAERFDTPLNIGDEVRFIVPSKSINGYIRVVEINEQFDEDGELIEATYTFGNENIANQYRKMQYDSVQDLRDLLLGKKPILYSVLPKAVREATNVINAGESSSFEYRRNGIYGFNTENPLGVTRYNANGIGFSRDGGQTYSNAMTYLGVVAESITAGDIFGVRISSQDQDGYFLVNGSDAVFTNTNNGRKVSISPDGLYGWNALGDTRFQADSLLVTSSALGTSNYNVYLAPMDGGEARVVRYSDIPGDGLVGSYNYQPIRAEGFYGNYWNINAAANGLHLYARPFSGGELRVTLNGMTTNYQDVRAAGIHANRLSNNTIFGESSHLFLSPKSDGEVRVTSVGSSDSYRPVRATGYYGAFLDTTATHLYARPGGDPGELRVTVRGTTDVYQPVRAKEFIIDTSDRGNKKNIEIYHESTLDTFRNMDIYLYNRRTDKNDERKQLGAMIDELPEVTHSAAGDSFALYAYTSYLAKGIKDLIEVVDNQEKKIKLLEDK